MTPTCCDVQGHTCNQGRDCPVAQARHCHALGVCQSKGCADCDAFECEVACAPEPARPTHPFAPGVIDGPDRAPMSRRAMVIDLLLLLASVAVIGVLAGYLMERFA